MWHWKVERHAKKLNALSARYRVEARKIGFLVDTLHVKDESGGLNEQAVAWGNTALIAFREGTHEAEIAWAARDVPGMNRAVRRIRGARSLLERALDTWRIASA